MPIAEEDAEVKDEPLAPEQLTQEQLTVIEDGLQAAHEVIEHFTKGSRHVKRGDRQLTYKYQGQCWACEDRARH